MEEATLDFANAAPGNMGRQRAESDRSGQNQNSFESSTPAANQKKYLEFGCEYGCTKFTFAIFRGEEEIFRVQSKIGE